MNHEATMEQQSMQRTAHSHHEPRATATPVEPKQPWQPPKLAFVEPKLTHHGKVQEVTGQSFGTFTPGP